MGSGSSAGGGSTGGVSSGQGGMMGSGYTAASLSCVAPDGLPGARVNVTLGDMGMSQKMGGTAPMGARVVPIAQPAAVQAGQVSFVVANRGWRTHERVVLPLPEGASAGQRIPSSDGRWTRPGASVRLPAPAAPKPGKGSRPERLAGSP